jgi:hypothetical protein
MAIVNVQGTDELGNLVLKVSQWEHDGLDAVHRSRLYEAAPHLLLMCEVYSKRMHIELDSKEDGLGLGRALLSDIDTLIARAKAQKGV